LLLTDPRQAIKQYKRSYRDHDHELGTLGEQDDDVSRVFFPSGHVFASPSIYEFIHTNLITVFPSPAFNKHNKPFNKPNPTNKQMN
jgi:hypothetical protein